MFKILKYLIISLIYLNLITDYSHPQGSEHLILTVEEAVEIAKKNNPSLDLTKADIAIAKSRVRKAKSNYYPQIKSKLVVPLIGTESGVSLDQLIWDFGRTSNLVKARELESEASEYDHEQNIDDVVTDTKLSYYRAVIAMNNTKAIRKEVEKNDLLLAKARELYKSGRSSNISLTEANSNLAESKLKLTNAENIEEARRVELFNIMGIDQDSRYELVEELDVEKIKYNLNESIEKAHNNSLTLKKLQAELAGIEARRSARKSEFLPEVFGRTAYRLKGEGTDEEGTDTPSFIAGVGIKFPIFLGFSRFAELDESNAQYIRAQSSIRHAKENVSSSIKKIYLDLNYAIKRIDVTRNNLDLAEENLELIREKETMGRASKLDVVDAETFYSQSLAEHKEAVYYYKMTKTRYDRMIGETD